MFSFKKPIFLLSILFFTNISYASSFKIDNKYEIKQCFLYLNNEKIEHVSKIEIEFTKYSLELYYKQSLHSIMFDEEIPSEILSKVKSLPQDCKK